MGFLRLIFFNLPYTYMIHIVIPDHATVSCVLHHSLIFQKLAHGGLIRNAAFLVTAENATL